MKTLEWRICDSSTRIIVGRGALSSLASLDGDGVVIHSRSIDVNPVLSNINTNKLVIPVDDGEEFKSIDNVIKLLEVIARKAPPDVEWIAAVGGGTVLDVVGFIASIYKRGVDLINIPTTLLAMVDAAMGGKNAVNFAEAKNIIGTFYQPRLVVSDTVFLDTLSDSEISNGMAEVVKYCIVLDRELCWFLLSNRDGVFERNHEVLEELVYKSALNKMSIVAQDPREKNRVRIVLNFGHTIGHSVEAGSNFKTPHGRAVALGMVCETRIAEELGVVDSEVSRVLVELLKLYGLPSSISELGVDVDIEKAARALRRDKKRRGETIDLPLPVKLGSWRRIELPLSDLEVYLKRCLK